MSEQKHTLGPWTVGSLGGNSGDAEAIAVLDNDDFVIADVWADTAGLMPAAEANARLIAAAPELLASLRKLVSAANELSLSMRQAPDYYALRAAVRDADAVISKAEGRS